MTIHPDDTTSSRDPLDQINPFTVLMDARLQLLAAVDALKGAEPERVATALGSVVAHDDAIGEVARAWGTGDRTFEGIATPRERAGSATVDEANAARSGLLEALSIAEVSFELEVAFPWSGVETWRLHLIGLAMHEGACAHALREGDPLPGFAEA